MKILYLLTSAIPSIVSVVSAGVLAYKGHGREVWGWFLFAGVGLGIFLFGSTLEALLKMESIKED